MSSFKLRFHVACENEQKWAVIDGNYGVPAAFGAEVLQGLTEAQAQTFSNILNDLHPPRAQPFDVGDGAMPLGLN